MLPPSTAGEEQKPETRETARAYHGALKTVCDPRAMSAMIPERNEVSTVVLPPKHRVMGAGVLVFVVFFFFAAELGFLQDWWPVSRACLLWPPLAARPDHLWTGDSVEKEARDLDVCATEVHFWYQTSQGVIHARPRLCCRVLRCNHVRSSRFSRS